MSVGMLMFQNLSQLQSIYVNTPFLSQNNIWRYLDPMAKKSLETLYLHSSIVMSEEFDSIFHGKTFPNLRKLVVLPEEERLSENFLSSLKYTYVKRLSIEKTIKLQTLIWCKFESLNEKEDLKTQLIGFIKESLTENFITVKNKDILHSYRYSPHIMGNFTLYRNVMEKRKLFFNENGEPKKHFSVDVPLIEDMEDDEFFKNNFTKW